MEVGNGTNKTDQSKLYIFMDSYRISSFYTLYKPPAVKRSFLIALINPFAVFAWCVNKVKRLAVCAAMRIRTGIDLLGWNRLSKISYNQL